MKDTGSIFRRGLRIAQQASVLCLMLFMLSGVALAQKDGKDGKDKDKEDKGKKGSAPEINVDSAIGALALLSGGMLVLTDKCKKKR